MSSYFAHLKSLALNWDSYPTMTTRSLQCTKFSHDEFLTDSNSQKFFLFPALGGTSPQNMNLLVKYVKSQSLVSQKNTQKTPIISWSDPHVSCFNAPFLLSHLLVINRGSIQFVGRRRVETPNFAMEKTWDPGTGGTVQLHRPFCWEIPTG